MRGTAAHGSLYDFTGESHSQVAQRMPQTDTLMSSSCSQVVIQTIVFSYFFPQDFCLSFFKFTWN